MASGMWAPLVCILLGVGVLPQGHAAPAAHPSEGLKPKATGSCAGGGRCEEEEEEEEVGLLHLRAKHGSDLSASSDRDGAQAYPRRLPHQAPDGKTVSVSMTIGNSLFAPYGSDRVSINMTVNGSSYYNGPTIEAVEGDIIEVAIYNGFFSQGTTVHWHGMHQVGTNLFDGVDFVTQCAFTPETTFTYRFVAYPAGTHWWHSHDGTQYADGLSGPLIIHPRKAPPPATHTEEVVVFLSDWSNYTATYELLTKLAGSDSAASAASTAATTVTTTTTSWGDISDVTWYGIIGNSESLLRLNPESAATAGSGAPTLAAQLADTAGQQLRLRIICGTSNQMLVISVPNVKLTVVAVDGQAIEPYGPVSSIQCAAGDRIDALVPQGAAVDKDYALQVWAVDGSDGAVVSQNAVTPSQPGLTKFWSVSGECDSAADAFDNTCITAMYGRGLKGARELQSEFPAGKVDKNVTMTLGGSMSNPYAWYINNISFTFPFPSLYESMGMSRVKVTDSNGYSFKSGTQIVDVEVGDVVDFFLENDSMMYHPFHLHGYSFWVLGSGNGTMPANPTMPAQPMLKDNQNVPAKGWTWLRVKADNPGWWIFHCHIDFHLATGMDLVVRVGNPLLINMANPMQPGFVKCPKTV